MPVRIAFCKSTTSGSSMRSLISDALLLFGHDQDRPEDGAAELQGLIHRQPRPVPAGRLGPVPQLQMVVGAEERNRRADRGGSAAAVIGKVVPDDGAGWRDAFEGAAFGACRYADGLAAMTARRGDRAAPYIAATPSASIAQRA
jgi:hypothetical protein